MRYIFKISLLVIVLAATSCKKKYLCTAKFGKVETVFKCENCKKDDLANYKKEIEAKGYTDVTCEK